MRQISAALMPAPPQKVTARLFLTLPTCAGIAPECVPEVSLRDRDVGVVAHRYDQAAPQTIAHVPGAAGVILQSRKAGQWVHRQPDLTKIPRDHDRRHIVYRWPYCSTTAAP